MRCKNLSIKFEVEWTDRLSEPSWSTNVCVLLMYRPSTLTGQSNRLGFLGKK